MANPLYQMLNGGVPFGAPPASNPVQPMSGAPMFQNPMQKMQYILQAMTNPAAFVKQHFPDIPNEIQNDPNQILGYLQRTRGISNDQVQQTQQPMSQIIGQGTVR